MDSSVIRAKFGDDYIANERTFLMGIDRRFTERIAERFRNRRVLETCTGAGFTTIALARVAAHVITVEIDPAHQTQAKQNLEKAGLLDRVTFVLGDIRDEGIWDGLPQVDAAFLDPDWAVTGLAMSTASCILLPGLPQIGYSKEPSVRPRTSPSSFLRDWTYTNSMRFKSTSARNCIWTKVTNFIASTLVISPCPWERPNCAYEELGR